MAPTVVKGGHVGLPVNSISADAPWRWLSAGIRDLRAAPGIGIAYGVGVVAAGLGLTVGLQWQGMLSLLPVFAGSFFLIGPYLAAGLYDTSRRLEVGEPISLHDAIHVQPVRRLQLSYMGFALLFVYLAWIRIATLLYALFAQGTFSPPENFVAHSLTTVNGFSLILVGTAIGGCLAAFVFSISVVSIPLLLDRPVDFVTAMITSLKAVQKNMWPMLIWAWTIFLLVAFGIGTLFLGLILVFPVIGFATWHAYREIVGDAP